jgi:multidrug efflux system membrane fusion protein
MHKKLPYFLLWLTLAAILPGCSKDSWSGWLSRSKEVLAKLGILGDKTSPPMKRAPAPVSVAVASLRDVPVQITGIGNVAPYATVAVKSQIGGELMQVHFKEGQEVSKGDLLFTIDLRPYEIQIKQIEATLSRDTVQWENARNDAKRYEELFRKNYAAQEQYDQYRTAAIALEGTVKAEKAALENARLQLDYCTIRAAITGRTGSLLVNQGNLIKANSDSAMVVIHQVRPIYVNFAVPEQHLPDIKKYMAYGELKVEAMSAGQQKAATGMLTFIDNTVDTTTGTIKLKATFANKEGELWPGQFVDVVLTLTVEPNLVVVPSAALQTGQKGLYVFVVKDDLSAEYRAVENPRNFGDEAVIMQGLRAGEKVVTNGQLRIVPGGLVEIKSSGETAKEQNK